MSPQILAGRFEIVKQLSHTDFSSVYLACDRHHLHRPHCIVTAIHYRDPQLRHRLEREAQQLERLGHHPQIPSVLAYFSESASLSTSAESHPFYIVCEHILGHPLSQEIVPGKPLSASYVTKLLQDVLVALSAVHTQGTLHQNLHPQHLIRQATGGHVFLTQFGVLPKLARSILGADGTLTDTVPMGLQPYLAPEQLQQNPQPASDLYALGLIAIEALTGDRHHNFAYDPQRGLLWRQALEHRQHTNDQTSIGLPLIEFIDRLVRHDWRDRFASANEALATLETENFRHRIAHDSRLPTVIAAPNARSDAGSNTQSNGRSDYSAQWTQPGRDVAAFPVSGRVTMLPSPAASQSARSSAPHRRPKSANPYLYKLAAGSLAALIGLGIGVKTYQWGEYRLSRLPETWQAWRTPIGQKPYPVAKPATLTPLMADGSILLQPAAAKAFWDMVIAAQADGIELYPLSGYRDSPQQDYSTGYALDIGGELEDADQQASFADTKAFKWLMDNAQTYGFALSAPKSNLITGKTSDEPWHWRYVGDTQSQQIFER
ncbi:MAG: D-alanyl-D-alanine carboxypeptidase family protein [Phormidesmis sp.]